MLEVHTVQVTPFVQNCTLLVCSKTGRAAICDCGEAAPVLAKVEEMGLEVEKILATHGHLDHISGTAEAKKALGVPFFFPSGDEFLRVALPEQANLYGWGEVESPEPDGDIQEGMDLKVGDTPLEVLHCPGHTPGHVVFHDAESEAVIVGDVLFQGSVGRTDFPRGSWEDLQDSIRTKLYTLPGHTLCHCGHGPTTSISREADSNPFVRA